MTRVGPLNWNTSIVDRQGRPTREFLQKWNAQNAVNGTIPGLDTPAEVSAVLDVLSGTANSLLIRGASQWGPLAPPADATKFLNGAGPPAWAQVKGSDLSMSDVTTNNVSTSQHGFAPKAPNDATKFLDGTGAYSVPSGGGGGGGLARVCSLGINGATTEVSADATKGNIIVPTRAMTINAVEIAFGNTRPMTLKAVIAAVSATTGLVTVGTVHYSTAVSVVSGYPGWTIWFDFATAVSLSIGQAYLIGVTRTDGSGTTSAPVNETVADNSNAAGPFQWYGCGFIATTLLAATNTFTISANGDKAFNVTGWGST